jgi:phthiocerol/phenolphthiocerol synthesis type-I polyketide synthase E
MSSESSFSSIAVIGLAVRVPGANDAIAFWKNLVGSMDSISRPTRDEAIQHGANAAFVQHPRHIAAAGRLEDVFGFDAEFFGFTPQQAVLTDPQHRLMLELGHEALEDAGYDPERFHGRIGVFAGLGLNSYLSQELLKHPSLLDAAGPDALMIGNDKGFGCTRLSYKLNLRGPNLCIDTACSSSLVAIHQACSSLLNHECDIALAGGVRIIIPHWDGDHHDEGGIHARDGICRAFDERAGGTVPGSGGALVVLRRLADARKDRDLVRAVVIGTAINNDGADKVSFTAPSVNGQVEVLKEALLVAGVMANSVHYVEAHGTGTPLGDRMELTALQEAYAVSPSGQSVDRLLGTVKTNIGHLDVASGVAGFAKTTLALQHGWIPASLHCERPNDLLQSSDAGFRISRGQQWPDGEPRRAAVSAFGIGGTNAHVVMEAAEPISPRADPGPEWQTLVLSAKSPSALERMRTNLAARLLDNPDISLSDVAHTLQQGRRIFALKCAITARAPAEAAAALSVPQPATSIPGTRPDVAMLFPGQGSHYRGMGSRLLRDLPPFRVEIERLLRLLPGALRHQVRDMILGDGCEDSWLLDTSLVQPAMFVFQYALGKVWLSAGVAPVVLAGHSLGEVAAACLAGVFSTEDALSLVVERGRLMQSTRPGAMLAVSLSEPEVAIEAGPCCVAAVNGPRQCVLAGVASDIHAIRDGLQARGVEVRLLRTIRAFHSRMMDPVIPELETFVARLKRHSPAIPIISSVDGLPLGDERAQSPAYWAGQIRRPVRFDLVCAALASTPNVLALEAGPGAHLGSFARQQGVPAERVVSSGASQPDDEQRQLAYAMGRLHVAGLPVDWSIVQGAGRPHRISLPTYPFERKSYRAGPTERESVAPAESSPPTAACIEVQKPADEIHAGVSEVWRDIIGSDGAASGLSFFDLGGDSLTATRLISRLRNRFEVALSMKDIYEASTRESLCLLLHKRLASPPPSVSSSNERVTGSL